MLRDRPIASDSFVDSGSSRSFRPRDLDLRLPKIMISIVRLYAPDPERWIRRLFLFIWSRQKARNNNWVGLAFSWVDKAGCRIQLVFVYGRIECTLEEPSMYI